MIISTNYTPRYSGAFIALYCILARFVATFPLGAVVNAIKRWYARNQDLEDEHLLSPGHLFAMCWAGLRGGIALALVMELGDWVPEEARDILHQATFALVLVFLLLFGGTTQCVLTA